MSERRSTPSQLPNTEQLRDMEQQGRRPNRANEPVTTANQLKPLRWVHRAAGVDGAGNQLYTVHLLNPRTGNEVQIAGPF